MITVSGLQAATQRRNTLRHTHFSFYQYLNIVMVGRWTGNVYVLTYQFIYLPSTRTNFKNNLPMYVGIDNKKKSIKLNSFNNKSLTMFKSQLEQTRRHVMTSPLARTRTLAHYDYWRGREVELTTRVAAILERAHVWKFKFQCLIKLLIYIQARRREM